jgi:hypothetical protein
VQPSGNFSPTEYMSVWSADWLHPETLYRLKSFSNGLG